VAAVFSDLEVLMKINLACLYKTIATAIICAFSIIQASGQPSTPSALSALEHWSLKLDPTDNPSTIVLSADGTMVATGSLDGAVKLYEAKGGKLLKSWRAGSRIAFLAFHQSKSQLVTLGRSPENRDTLRAWDFNGNELFSKIPHDLGTTIITRISPEGKTILTYGRDKNQGESIKLWSMDKLELRQIIPLGSGMPFSSVGLRDFQISPDGKILAFCIARRNDDAKSVGDLILWNLEKKQEIRTIRNGYPSNPPLNRTWTWFTSDSKQIITCDDSSRMTVWDIEDGKSAKKLQALEGKQFSFQRDYSMERNLIAVCHVESDKIVVLSAKDDIKPLSIDLSARRVAISRDGKHLAAVGGGEKAKVLTLHFWDLTLKSEK
jgi:WD40 repeat protein